jgi:hypothetical protein
MSGGRPHLAQDRRIQLGAIRDYFSWLDASISEVGQEPLHGSSFDGAVK